MSVSVTSIPFSLLTARPPAVVISNQLSVVAVVSGILCTPATVTTFSPVAVDETASTVRARPPAEVVVEVNTPVSVECDEINLSCFALPVEVGIGGLAGPSPVQTTVRARPATSVDTTIVDTVEADYAESYVIAPTVTVVATSPAVAEVDEVETSLTALVPEVVINDGLTPIGGLAASTVRARPADVSIFALLGGDGIEGEIAALPVEVLVSSGALPPVDAVLLYGFALPVTVSFDTDVPAIDAPSSELAANAPTVTVTSAESPVPDYAGSDVSALLATVEVLPGQVAPPSPAQSAVTARPVFVYAEGSGGVPQFAEITEVWAPITVAVELEANIVQIAAVTAHVAPTTTMYTTLWEGGLVAVQVRPAPRPPKPPFDPGEPDLPPPFPGG